MIEKLSEEYGYCIGRMCRIMQVSRSGYYKYLTEGKESSRARENKQILRVLMDVWLNNLRVYGSPRITAALRKMGYIINRKRVARLMRVNGIRALRRKAFIITTQSDHNCEVLPNLLLRNFKAEKLNQVWLSDITYIRTGEGFLYLTVIMDLCSRMPVAYNMATHIRARLIIEALDKAVRKRGATSGLIFHSDQGIQYAAEEFKQQLKDYGITQSMSFKGNCFDNAPMESFFHTLKSELVYLVKFDTRKDAEYAIKNYIDDFYTRRRLHSSLNYLSPKEFEENFFLA